MSQATALKPQTQRQTLRLSGVDWSTYTLLLRAFSRHPGFRLAYDRGELEIMSPSFEHDDDSDVLGSFVFILTDELDLPLKRGGSVTLRRKLRQRGIEADRCFWIANAHRMAGVRRLDLRRDPPPDLAIEVDVTHSSLNRLSMFARLRVPEVWRVDKDEIVFYILGASRRYTTATHSLSFPMLTPADLFRYLLQTRQAANETVVMRQFRAWVRQQVSGGSTPTP